MKREEDSFLKPSGKSIQAKQCQMWITSENVHSSSQERQRREDKRRKAEEERLRKEEAKGDVRGVLRGCRLLV